MTQFDDKSRSADTTQTPPDDSPIDGGGIGESGPLVTVKTYLMLKTDSGVEVLFCEVGPDGDLYALEDDAD